MSAKKPANAPKQDLAHAILEEGNRFQEAYRWLEKAMPPEFFDEVSHEDLMLVTHALIGFPLQDFFSIIHSQKTALALCLDTTDADVRILEHFRSYGIKSYRTFVSKITPLASGKGENLRVAYLHFTEVESNTEPPFSQDTLEQLRAHLRLLETEMSPHELEALLSTIDVRFLKSLPLPRLAQAFRLLCLAKDRDACQYEIERHEDWKKKNLPSVQLLLAWRNTGNSDFICRLARTVQRHGLVMKQVSASYLRPYSTESMLVMSLALQGPQDQAAWEVTSLSDLLEELSTTRYFDQDDLIRATFVQKELLSGSWGSFLRAVIPFVHQALVSVDPYRYSPEHVEETFCRHQELALLLCKLFSHKFDPKHRDLKVYEQERESYVGLVEKLDTGHEENDIRRKNVLRQGLNFVDHTLKTNFFVSNKSALGFRLDPTFLDHIPFNRKAKFPELPYAVFYLWRACFLGFHIRFKDLARGGLRTVFPEEPEKIRAEQDNVFNECYNLAYTQQKKNKDIPEGGSKGILFLKAHESIRHSAELLARELSASEGSEKEKEFKVIAYLKEQHLDMLHQAQRAYVETLLSLVNCDEDGTLRTQDIVDYWKRPEYLYLGPDELMHDEMIQWIAEWSKKVGYKPGAAFISSKPVTGVNHKHYGVTSLGLHVYVDEVLRSLSINPHTDSFTVKMSGGPDGDVAGNEIVNLYHAYPKTAKLIALTDISGTIYDPKGLDLVILVDLFHKTQPIRHYPPERLSQGGFLLDRFSKRSETAYTQQTLLWRKEEEVVQEWLSGSEMNRLYSHNVHTTPADLFIPAGGRPRTLNSANIQEFLDAKQQPTAKAIVEGANLYLTPAARRALEEKGVLVIKDSSANKAGVVCSSFEVLCGLTLDEPTFLLYKDTFVQEILERVKTCALDEARLLLKTHRETGAFLTDISDKISEQINRYTYDLLDYLEPLSLSKDPHDPLVHCFLDYCLPTLKNQFSHQLLSQVPVHHKKAIIACHVASQLVYRNGIEWAPSVADILPLVLERMSR